MRPMSDLSASLTPLAGGHSGRTFLSEVAGSRSVVRIYPPGDARGPEAPQVDAAVLHLVRGLVPVADVLEVRRGEGGLPEWLQARLVTWSASERASLVPVAEEAQGRLDGVGRACLVHSDLNPKN